MKFNQWLIENGFSDTLGQPIFDAVYSECFGEMQDAAAQVGIDLSFNDLAGFRAGTKTRGLTLLDKSYKGKVFVSVRANKNGFPAWNFYTNKHGGISQAVRSNDVLFERFKRDELLEPAKPVEKRQAIPQKKQSAEFDMESWREQKLIDFSKLFNTLSNATESAYISDKGFDPAKLSSLNIKRGIDQKGAFIAIPIRKPDNTVSFQFIYDHKFKPADGGDPINKYFLGSYSGGSFVIGEMDHSKPIYFCEGFATGLSIHLATGCMVVVCFAANNIEKVVRKYQGKHKKLVICADNDHSEKGNTGVKIGLSTAFFTGAELAIPCFDRKADFDDLRTQAQAAHGGDMSAGLAAVRNALRHNKIAIPKNLFELDLALISYAHKPELAKLANTACYHASLYIATKAELRSAARRIQGAMFKRGLPYRAARRIWSKCAKQMDTVRASYTVSKAMQSGLKVVDIRGWTDDEISEFILENPGVYFDPRQLGKGKTQLMVECCRKGRQMTIDYRCVTYIAHRVSLIKGAAKRIGLSYYQDVSAFAGEKPETLAVCVNSINKHFTQSRDGWLFIDEIRQTLEHILLGPVDNRADVFSALSDTIGNHEWVICADADLNDKTVEWVKSSTNKDCYLLYAGEPQSNGKTIIELENNDAVMLHARQTILDGDNVIIATDSTIQALKAMFAVGQDVDLSRHDDLKTFVASAFKGALSADDILLVTGDNKGDPRQAAFLADPNEESKKYRLVIYTPVISSGVSITNTHFKCAYAMFANVLQPNEMLQSIARVRTVSTVYAAFKSSHKKDRLTDVAQLIDGEAKLRLSYDAVQGVLELDDFDKKRLELIAQRNAELNDYRKIFLRLAQLKGYAVRTFTTGGGDDTPSPKIKRLSRMARDVRVNSILAAEKVDAIKAVKLEKEDNKTQAESDALFRYEAAVITGKTQDELDGGDVEFFLDGGGRMVKNYETLHESLIKLQARDRDDRGRKQRMTSLSAIKQMGEAVLNPLIDQVFNDEKLKEFCDYLNEHSAELALCKLGNYKKKSAYPVRTVGAFAKRFGYEVVEVTRDAAMKADRSRWYSLQLNEYVLGCYERRIKAKFGAALAAECTQI